MRSKARSGTVRRLWVYKRGAWTAIFVYFLFLALVYLLFGFSYSSGEMR